VLERLNREFGTRTRLVGIFRSETSLLRFVTALLMEMMPIPFIQVVSKRGWGVDRVIVV